METFVDGYDWVTVPNAYAMCQNADGGLITTNPYFSGSSYVRKMSHQKKGRGAMPGTVRTGGGSRITPILCQANRGGQ